MTFKLNSNGYLVADAKHIHKEYKKSSDLTEKPLNYKMFREVIEFMFTRIWLYLITETWIFKAPHKFGEIYISEVMGSSGFYKNWKLTKKNGPVVEDYNLHTNGIKFFVKWNKNFARVINQGGYRFVPFRGDSDKPLGKRGINWWTRKCSADPMLKDYRAHIL